MLENYPLCWPAGNPRTRYPITSRFDVTFARAREAVLHQIRLLGGKDVVLSTNIPLKRDGFAYANFKEPADQGVAVYFMLKGKQMCFACDQWAYIRENMQAVAKTIEALRGIKRWGSGSMLEQAFMGFVALPAPTDPWKVIGLPKGVYNEAQIAEAYRRRALLVHPDILGGSQEAMQELNNASQKIKMECGV